MHKLKYRYIPWVSCKLVTPCDIEINFALLKEKKNNITKLNLDNCVNSWNLLKNCTKNEFKITRCKLESLFFTTFEF